MLSLLAPAKINLFLNLEGLRPDGFHEIRTVMQTVTLWDRLDIRPSLKTGGLEFSCNVPEFERNADENLVVRAYHLFFQTTGLPSLGLHVHLEKQTPTQAGLGGGSSDAAAMLLALNHLSFAALPSDVLAALAARLGSDVAFFLTGGTALATGRGEMIEPLALAPPVLFPLVIIKPRRLGIPTPEAYRLVREAMGQPGRGYQARSPEHLLMALRRAKSHEELTSYLHNDFEPVLFEHYPALGDMARQMREVGVQRPLLSGSGPAMLGFIDATPQNRKRVERTFPEAEYEVFWAQTTPQGLRQEGAPRTVYPV